MSAIATEARQGGDGEAGSVHEGAGLAEASPETSLPSPPSPPEQHHAGR